MKPPAVLAEQANPAKSGDAKLQTYTRAGMVAELPKTGPSSRPTCPGHGRAFCCARMTQDQVRNKTAVQPASAGSWQIPAIRARCLRSITRRSSSAELSRLATLSEDNPNPIVEIARTGQVRYVNPAGLAKFPDLPRRGFRHPILEGLTTALVALRQRGRYALEREIRLGNEAYGQKIIGSPTSDSIRIYMDDLTDRKGTEARLQMANTTLVNLLADLKRSNQHLQSTQSQLIQAEKMSAVGQLASGIAHEVKNPLAIILEGITYLEQDLRPDQPQQCKILLLMKEAVARADKIVLGLLNLSRPAPLELTPIAISRIVEDALALVRQQLAVGNIHITNDIPSDLPLVMVDENQMQQALLNLMLNAFQAMPNGGRLMIRSYTKTLTEVGNRVGNRATDVFRLGRRILGCEIEDTGGGIPERLLSKVFDPFFTTKPPGHGTGLGLAITKTIIERHHGLIEIMSQEGRGTTVRILLPTIGRRGDDQEEAPLRR